MRNAKQGEYIECLIPFIIWFLFGAGKANKTISTYEFELLIIDILTPNK